MSWLFCYINHIINVANYTVTPRCLGLIFAAVPPGPAMAMCFALYLLPLLKGEDVARQVGAGMLVK